MSKPMLDQSTLSAKVDRLETQIEKLIDRLAQIERERQAEAKAKHTVRVDHQPRLWFEN